ncbi:MAG: tungstate ABC transporter substrate-binding protein WtpA [Bacteroidales bacterium]|nr:tungstate ABC transporter substrate-binding protein WtpA [Bacteroidales bacterium]
MKIKITAFLSILLIIFVAACTGGGKKEVIIFHAGSLSVPLKEISNTYMDSHPGVVIKLEGAGSVACARKITELGKKCDIMASADYKVIEKFLIPEYAKWDIRFASNELVIAFTERSEYSDIISAGNWYEILSRDDVVYGRSDPDADPCGYRTILMFKLADMYYDTDNIYKGLKEKDTNMIRPKEVDLVALLESGSLDYIVQYKSVSEQHGLNYITLPREMNLSDPALNDLYKSVSVEIVGEKPGEYVTVKGSSMVYALTIPDNAPSVDEAVKFLNFFLGKEGREILARHGQSPLELSVSGNTESLPPDLKNLFLK